MVLRSVVCSGCWRSVCIAVTLRFVMKMWLVVLRCFSVPFMKLFPFYLVTTLVFAFLFGGCQFLIVELRCSSQ